MAYLRARCLVLVGTFFGVCQAQCILRTLMPSMAVMECTSGSAGGSTSSSSSADNCIIRLPRALEMEKSSCANHGIDINGLLNTLIHALVHCATFSPGSSGSFTPTCGSGSGYAPVSPSGTSPSNTGGSSGSGGLAATLKGLADPLSELIGGGEGGSGVTGLTAGLTDTVETLLGGDNSGSDGLGKTVGGVTGTVGGLLGGGSGGLLGGGSGGLL